MVSPRRWRTGIAPLGVLVLSATTAFLASWHRPRGTDATALGAKKRGGRGRYKPIKDPDFEKEVDWRMSKAFDVRGKDKKEDDRRKRAKGFERRALLNPPSGAGEQRLPEPELRRGDEYYKRFRNKPDEYYKALPDESRFDPIGSYEDQEEMEKVQRRAHRKDPELARLKPYAEEIEREEVDRQLQSQRRLSAELKAMPTPKPSLPPSKSALLGRYFGGSVKEFAGSFGWLQCPEVASAFEGSDVFVQRKAIHRSARGKLKADVKVTFQLKQDAKGNLIAEDVTLHGAAQVVPDEPEELQAALPQEPEVDDDVDEDDEDDELAALRAQAADMLRR